MMYLAKQIMLVQAGSELVNGSASSNGLESSNELEREPGVGPETRTHVLPRRPRFQKIASSRGTTSLRMTKKQKGASAEPRGFQRQASRRPSATIQQQQGAASAGSTVSLPPINPSSHADQIQQEQSRQAAIALKKAKREERKRRGPKSAVKLLNSPKHLQLVRAMKETTLEPSDIFEYMQQGITGESELKLVLPSMFDAALECHSQWLGLRLKQLCNDEFDEPNSPAIQKLNAIFSGIAERGDHEELEATAKNIFLNTSTEGMTKQILFRLRLILGIHPPELKNPLLPALVNIMQEPTYNHNTLEYVLKIADDDVYHMTKEDHQTLTDAAVFCALQRNKPELAAKKLTIMFVDNEAFRQNCATRLRNHYPQDHPWIKKQLNSLRLLNSEQLKDKLEAHALEVGSQIAPKVPYSDEFSENDPHVEIEHCVKASFERLVIDAVHHISNRTKSQNPVETQLLEYVAIEVPKHVINYIDQTWIQKGEAKLEKLEKRQPSGPEEQHEQKTSIGKEKEWIKYCQFLRNNLVKQQTK